MTKVLLLSTVMVFGPALTFGQAGAIGTYADPAGLNCNVVDGVPGLLPIFVVHTLTPGALAVQFAAPIQLCMMGMLWLSDTPVFAVTIGDSQTGVAIGYGNCQAAPIHNLTINYFANGLTALCCPYPVVADPSVASGQIEVIPCAGGPLFGSGLANTVNGNAAQCGCGSPPVEETSWGAVKALYQ